MIKEFFKSLLEQESQPEQLDVSLAAAVLLVEITKADHQIDNNEKAELLKAIQSLTGLPESQAQVLYDQALEVSEDANDLYRFTSQIHKLFNYDKKMELMISLWKVAFADAVLDKYEEYSIRRIAELLYIPHGDFIRSKILAKERVDQ